MDISQAVDLVTTTLSSYDKNKWTDLTSDLQRFLALPQMLKKKKVQMEAGSDFRWFIMTDDNGAARNTGMFSVDNVQQVDVMVEANMPWRHTETNWSWDLLEFKINRGPNALLNLIKNRRSQGYVSLAKRMETDWWSSPAAGSADTITPMGIPYWCVIKTTGSSAASSTGEFGGTTATGYTTVGGVNPTVYLRHANWTQAYGTVTRDDLVLKMRKGAEYTHFESPVPMPGPQATKPDRGYYTVWNVVEAFERLAEDRNDRLGVDMDPYSGRATFQHNMIYRVPQLDEDSGVTNDPIYQIDWSVFYPVFLETDWMAETKPEKAPDQHRVVQQFVDSTWNTKCEDRRRLAVYATA
jgi:hypothetical protein